MRQPKPWFRASKNAWYVEHRGKQVRLGEHPEDAPPPKKSKDTWNAPQRIVDAFYKLMASDPSCVPEPEKLLVVQVCDMFLSHFERHNERDTYLWYKHFLQNFADFYPRLTASELKPIHVTRWLDDQLNWKGGRRNAVIAIKRVFNWADKVETRVQYTIPCAGQLSVKRGRR